MQVFQVIQRLVGIVGETSGTVSKCFNAGAISTSAIGGGIAGLSKGTVQYTYNNASITSTETTAKIGGIAGEISDAGKIKKSYNIGSISNLTLAGGILGNGLDVENCVYLATSAVGGISGADIAGKAVARSSRYMKSKYVLNDIGETTETIWKIISMDSYPMLEWQSGENVVTGFSGISSEQELVDFEYIINTTSDTFEDKIVELLADLEIKRDSWTPIGQLLETDGFLGTFDGKGHTITVRNLDNTLNGVYSSPYKVKDE